VKKPILFMSKAMIWGQTSRAYWSLLIFCVMVSRNLFLQVKCLISITTRRFYSATTPSWSTMTTYQHTLACQCSNFWPLKTETPYPSFFTWIGPLWFLLIYENETADITTQNSNKPVPGMSGPLHKLRQVTTMNNSKCKRIFCCWLSLENYEHSLV
jgi:hypothetical protein